MDETKVALIPRVIMAGALGPKEYAILLTDRRSILVLEDASKAGLGAALGGVVGAAIARAASTRREIDYAHADPERLAQDEKNLVISYIAIRRLELRKKLAGYSLLIEYARSDGKLKKVQAAIVPPADHIKSEKARGVPTKATARAYAEHVRDALKKALPPGQAAAAEWSL